jgi:hypothetical protein
MTQDQFEEEAFEGLSQLSGEELEADMESMSNILDKKIQKNKNFRIFPYWRVAAAVAFLTGIGALLFILLRTPEPELLTQKADKQYTQTPETALPSIPESQKKEVPETTINKKGIITTQPSATRRKSEELERKSSEIDEIISYQTLDETTEISAAAEQPEMVAKVAGPDPYADTLYAGAGYITGRVLGVNRKALSGVSISEEGTNQVATTDRNGNFRIKVSNPASKIELSYAGYKNTEVPSKEIAGKEISLDEELNAADDILVLNYNNVKREESSPRAANKAKTAESSTDTYRRPFPPGGSMKDFEAWVENRIDTVLLKELLPGNYRIRVKLTVYKDGKIGNITVPNDVPDIAAEEYRRAVSLSERWQPAMVGNLPIDSDIMIEFSLKIK